MKKIIDLFSGCGGLLEGFLKEGNYIPVASVEWKREPIENLKNRLKNYWKIEDAEKSCIRMDIQETEKLLKGWSNDGEYEDSKGLDYFVEKSGGKIDLIIGGPPCQAYSLAGRIRDINGMRDDYRNFLFESYLRIVDRYKPDFFIFENVEGMLSAKPNGKLITEVMKENIENIGYGIVDNLKNAIVEMAEYGIPQSRKRVIILGVNKKKYKNFKEILEEFYISILPKFKAEKNVLANVLSDLPQFFPTEEYKVKGKKFSHTYEKKIKNHEPRYHNERDIKIFKILAEDAQGDKKYITTKAKNEIYFKYTGKTTNVHKYHVLKSNEISTTICAHLKKDGLRYIHPDARQARSITVREAARIQTFDDSYEFISSQSSNYEMIGNAVPPKFSLILAKCLNEIFKKYC